jgi:hypothetical protein
LSRDELSILSGREVILEFHTIGQIVKVSAIDADTGIEVSIQGPAMSGELVLKNNALRRLIYVLRKKNILN